MFHDRAAVGLVAATTTTLAAPPRYPDPTLGA